MLVPGVCARGNALGQNEPQRTTARHEDRTGPPATDTRPGHGHPLSKGTVAAALGTLGTAVRTFEEAVTELLRIQAEEAHQSAYDNELAAEESRE